MPSTNMLPAEEKGRREEKQLFGRFVTAIYSLLVYKGAPCYYASQPPCALSYRPFGKQIPSPLLPTKPLSPLSQQVLDPYAIHINLLAPGLSNSTDLSLPCIVLTAVVN